MTRKVTKGKHFKIAETTDLDGLLGAMPIEMRGPALKEALTNGGHVVARAMDRHAPVESPNINNPEAVQLKDSHDVKAMEFPNGSAIAIVGAAIGKGKGFHSHLLDLGHDVKVSRGPRVGQAPETGSPKIAGKQYMVAAIASSDKAAQRAVIKSLERAAAKAAKK